MVSARRPTNTIAAARNTHSKWNSSVIPVGPLVVRIPSIGASRTKVTNAAANASFRAGAARETDGVVAPALVAMRLDLLDRGLAEQAGGQEDQDHDQDAEGGHVLVLQAEIARPERLDQAEHQAAQHRSGNGADPAQDRGGEGLHAGEEADEKVDHAII